jgi:tRNA(fMet)-specific endonuclease VapC
VSVEVRPEGESGRTDRGLLDTSTVIFLPRLVEPRALPREPLITTITLAELSVGPLVTDDEDERAVRQAHLQQAESDFDPLPFDASAARAFGRVAASLRRTGRKTAARAYDAMIAAIALANDLPLYTCNPSDFAGIDGLTVVAVPVSGHS